jgi:hypothetical protein
LQSFKTIARNGSLISAPKKWNKSAGVTKIPAILLITALQMEVATFPPPADVSMMHILIVVGKQVIMRKPSTKAGGRAFGITVVRNDLIGNPIRKGHNPNMTS